MRKIYFLVLLLPLFSIAQKLDGQPLIDSLLVALPKMKEDSLKVNLINSLAYAYRDINRDKHFKYANEGLNLSKKLNYNFGVIEANRNLGVYYLSTKTDKSNSYFKYVLKYATDKTQLAKAYFGLGYIISQEANFPKSLEYYLKGLKLAEEDKNHPLYAKFLLNIGVDFHYSKDLKKAILYYEQGLEYNKKHGNTEDDNLRLHHLALCYKDLKQYEKALKYIDEAEKINDKLGLLKFKAACNEVKAHIYWWQGKYELALEIYKKSLKIYVSIGDNFFIGSCYSNIARTYVSLAEKNKNISLKKNYLNEATEAINKVIILVKKSKDIRQLSECYLTLWDIQKVQGNYKAALESHEQYVIYKDSVFNSDNKETIKNLEDKREIELRDKQIKINKLAIESKEKQKWFYILGLGFLGILGGLLFYQSRSRRKTNTKLQSLNDNLDTKIIELDQANKTKIRFFNILNHDLRGPVSNLIDFLQIQKNTPEILDEETKNRIQDTTLSSAENLLVSMEDILLWSKGQMENFKPQPKNIAVNQLFEDTKKVFSGYIKISFEYQNPENIEIFTDENYLKTIIRNLTSNAINVLAEYVTSSAIEKQIVWKAWQEDETKYLSVTDNGPGASSENFKALYDDTHVVGIKSGLGLHLIRDLAKAIDCEIVVESKIDVGTTFILKFKDLNSL